ncbi:MAG: hypothetical protein KAR37_16200 [Alphaproteobacteria bacterium]|nr:hypothetical protein [Alphaproteobacteria bacterium]
MRKIFTTFVAALGLIGFAAAAQADCGHDLDVATADDTSTVATDTTTTKPILQEQGGG